MTDAAVRPAVQRSRIKSSLTDWDILGPAIWNSFLKLDPRWQIRNPVMFVVEVGSVITTIAFFIGLFRHGTNESFVGQISIWLWFTVIFANLAEAVAEGRGKAQAAALRRTRADTLARRLGDDGKEEQVPGTQLRRGDRVVCEAGDVSRATARDRGHRLGGRVRMTGESAPVIREAGGDRSAVTGGTTVLSDRS